MAIKKDILKDVKLFVLDMDGTFYLGDRIFKGSLPFLDAIRESGKDFLFFTNNSSKTPELYIEKLKRMGCEIDRSGIMTSGDVTIRYLETFHKGESVFLMGTEALRNQFRESGINLAEGPPDIAGRERPDVVVCAFDTELNYYKLERACSAIRNGAVFLATHPDINCPTETGFIPDCGALCAAVALSAGRPPRYLGKPFPETPDMILSATGYAAADIAFVGDRLYTDVAAGVNNGAKGFLVLSGETRAEDVAGSGVAPDAVFADLGEMAAYLR
ncbi:MAG: HAD-IIA family hydrolase [Clostridiales Family XIII bacterium]|jgi:HAD superfamily hydrolase (TIGR01450 family)|nr:HAD-IIA family hydrolase [Clostridiales Family XIII bacterium]